MTDLGQRIIVLIDMDCFFCQVETKLKPEYVGKPLAVVQFTLWGSGSIIAVNYEARDFGITRHMRTEEAKEKCPNIVLVTVPPIRGKPDTSRYRSAGREVIEVLKKNCNLVERASIDEAYLDITYIIDEQIAKGSIDYKSILDQLKTTYIVGHSECDINIEEHRKEGLNIWLSEALEDSQIQRLALAGIFVENVRREILDVTGFECSAGISFNKILAKLACGLHKPNRQTILPASSVPKLFGSLPIKKVRNLGGKLGDIIIESLSCNVMGGLLQYSLQYLQNRFDEKTGLWLYNIARGIDSEPVTPRLVSKSIGACKRFPGKQSITDPEVLRHWVGELSAELCERLEQDLEENERKATHLTISYQYYQNRSAVSQSKSCVLTSYKKEKVAEMFFNIVTKVTQQHPVAFIGLSAGKFIKAKGSETFINFFKIDASKTNVGFAHNTRINKIISENEDKPNKPYAKSSIDKNITETVLNKNLNFTDKIQEKKNNGAIENVKHIKTPFEKVKTKRKSSPCSKLQSTLKTDNFKKSFFINILKDKKSNDEVLAEKLDEGKPELNNQDVEIDKNSNVSDDSSNIFYNNTEKEKRTSGKKISLSPINNYYEIAQKMQEINEEASSSKVVPQPINNANEASVKLQEIFPDLNDIDPTVVLLLPIQLQDEARKLIKMKEIQEKKIEVERLSKNKKEKEKDSSKTSKVKPQKSKSIIIQKSRIQNFFIKTDVNNDSNDNFKKCDQCDQLILINKFDEHIDFHVAQNVYKEINQLSNDNDSRKRRVHLDSQKHIKKQLSDEFVKSPFFNNI